MTYNEICQEIVRRNGVNTLSEIVNDSITAFRVDGIEELMDYVGHFLSYLHTDDKITFTKHITDLVFDGVVSVNY